MTLAQNLIIGNNISHAWAQASSLCYQATGGIVSPAVVEIKIPEADQEIEDVNFRRIADRCICLPDKPNMKIETVAGTIFPWSIWKLTKNTGRKEFFNLYKKCLPHIKQCQQNIYGVYFERMISFRGDASKPHINQLEHIIQTWNSGNHRHSALQISIFDPLYDHHKSRQRGFPCLNQIALHADGSNGTNGLTITAFYATQTLMEKAYGNYLGLYRLGVFMAKEMGITLKRVICITSALKFSNGEAKSSFSAEMQDITKNLNNAIKACH
jgi:hypothetical protein